MADEPCSAPRKSRKDKKLRGPCRIEGCDATAKHWDLCQLHYGRLMRKGDAEWQPPAFQKPTCQIEGCERDAAAKGLCRRHYYRLRDGKPAEPVKREPKPCSADGCGKVSKRRGLCSLHWDRSQGVLSRSDRARLRAALDASIKKCSYCGVQFVSPRGRVHCTEKCRRRELSRKELDCSECGASFVRPVGSKTGVCSDSCRADRRKRLEVEKQATAERRAQKRAANARYSRRHRERVRRYYRTKRRLDPDFSMACWMRSTLHKVLSRANRRKDAKCVELLGYTRHQLRQHIEAQFTKGMSWDNRGKWHIDHIVPVAEFMRRGETDPAIVNALSNLRPMWAKDNIRKSDKVASLL